MADVSNSKLLEINTGILPKDACVVIVRTEWNASIVDELEKGCIETLRAHTATPPEVLVVPGSFEAPFAVMQHWKKSKQKPDAYIVLGCVIRGGTPHFEYVSQAITDGVLKLNLELPVPSIFGVLTVDNVLQAMERTGGEHGHKGKEAAITALKMIALNRSLEAEV